MACDYSTGVGLGCKDVIGGIKSLYFLQMELHLIPLQPQT